MGPPSPYDPSHRKVPWNWNIFLCITGMGYVDFSRLDLLNIFASKCKKNPFVELLCASPMRSEYSDGEGSSGLGLRDFGFRCRRSQVYWVHASSGTSLYGWTVTVGLSRLSLEGFPLSPDISRDRLRQTFTSSFLTVSSQLPPNLYLLFSSTVGVAVAMEAEAGRGGGSGGEVCRAFCFWLARGAVTGRVHLRSGSSWG